MVKSEDALGVAPVSWLGSSCFAVSVVRTGRNDAGGETFSEEVMVHCDGEFCSEGKGTSITTIVAP